MNQIAMHPESDIPVIDVTGVTKVFGKKTVVNGIDMKVHRGEIYGFLGPNGSGKTTFLRMLCGLLVPDGGSGTCLGFDIVKQSRMIKPRVGYMAQKFSLYTDLSVQENLLFTARIYGVKKRHAVVRDMISRMELDPFMHQLAGSLSGGWKQRLALAACMLHDPDLLLLDEPTAGVDPKARRDFWDQVHKLTSEGMTALITTHYMDEAERCHRLAYIAYGNLLASGTVQNVIDQEGLASFEIRGPEIYTLGEQLKAIPAIEQVVPFGNTLHVSGKNEEGMRSNLESVVDAKYEWHQIEPSLEEVFISLMNRARSGAQ